jgi:hypothetical protein
MTLDFRATATPQPRRGTVFGVAPHPRSSSLREKKFGPSE